MKQHRLAQAVRIAFPGRGDFDDRVDHDIGDAVLSTALQPKLRARLVEGGAHELEVVWIDCSPGKRHSVSPLRSKASSYLLGGIVCSRSATNAHDDVILCEMGAVRAVRNGEPERRTSARSWHPGPQSERLHRGRH